MDVLRDCRVRWLPLLALASLLIFGSTFAIRVEAKPSHETQRLLELQAQLAEKQNLRFQEISQVALDNPERWTFVWIADQRLLLEGLTPGLDEAAGRAFLHSWYTEWAPRYHYRGDYYPLFMIKQDGSEIRVGLRRKDGTVSVLRTVPFFDQQSGSPAWKMVEEL